MGFVGEIGKFILVFALCAHAGLIVFADKDFPQEFN